VIARRPRRRQDDSQLRWSPPISPNDGIGSAAQAFQRHDPHEEELDSMTEFTRTDETTTLNTLISTLIDSVTGFEDAAANIEGSSRLQQLFRERASERRQVVEELRAEVRRLGGNAEDDGSFMGKAHQRFLDLKSVVTGRDEQAIINEVERGEDYLKEKFETALNSGTLSGESRAVVERAYQSVRSGHDQVSALKHGLEV
jgi:uncharacterized protein (TIGR02284 family)